MIRTEELSSLRTAINLYCIEEGRFPISDGNFVSSWIDLYPLTCSTKMMSMLTNSLATKLFTTPWQFEYIAGKELHGALLACNLVNSHRFLESDLIIVRKEDNIVKTPYHIDSTRNCILVDEVISSGTNMMSSIEYLHNKGFKVTGVICVIYRGGGAKEKAEEIGIPFTSLFDIPEKVIC